MNRPTIRVPLAVSLRGSVAVLALGVVSTLTLRAPGPALAAGTGQGAPGTNPAPAAVGALQGRWKGAITLPGAELGISVKFGSGPQGALHGVIDIPQQGAHELALSALSLGDSGKVHFELPTSRSTAHFDGRLVGDTLSGSFEQGGFVGPFALARTAEPDSSALRGAAAPPLPYDEREVEVRNGAVTLAGTLTLPRTRGAHPAVFLITGSGPQNRDEELFGFKPFQVIADGLTRRGIAVLRVDDRGVGGSSGNFQIATTEDFAGDAQAAVAFLRSRKDIDSRHVGLLGHSEGGLVAPIVATRSRDVAFVVLLAGPAVTGERILLAQGELIGRAMGRTDSAVARERGLQTEIFRAIRTDLGWDSVEAHIGSALREQMAELPAEHRAAIADTGAYIRTQLQGQMASARSPWMKYFVTYDPAPALQRLRCPVLALFGEKDLQVPASLNREPMEGALKQSGNRDVTVRVLPRANHLFLPSETGSPVEYASMKKEFVPGMLDTIADWITARAK